MKHEIESKIKFVRYLVEVYIIFLIVNISLLFSLTLYKYIIV